MKVLVTGSSGFVGTHLVRTLVADGYEVRALVYEPERAALVESLGAEVMVGGLDSADFLRQAMKGCEGLFHLAALISLSGSPEAWEESRLVNVTGTRNVMEAALAAKMPRVVHTSSVIAVGLTAEERLLDEAAPWMPPPIHLPYIATKREGEDIVREYVQKGLDAVIVNPGAIFGPHDYFQSANSKLFLEYLKGMTAVAFRVRHSWVDVRDVARGLVLAFEKGRTGERYLLGGTNTNAAHIMTLLDKFTGLGKPFVTFDYPITVGMAALVEAFVSDPPITRDIARLVKWVNWVSIEKARKELGYNPRPLEESLRETIEWYLADRKEKSHPPEVRPLTEAPLQFFHEAHLAAPPEKVFAFLADFVRLPEWMPLMTRVEVDSSQAETLGGKGAVRRIFSYAGPPTEETIRAFEPPRMLAYSASDKSLMGMFTGHTGVLTCQPATGGGTYFTWRTYAQPGRWMVMRGIGNLVFRYVIGKSVRNLKKRFG